MAMMIATTFVDSMMMRVRRANVLRRHDVGYATWVWDMLHYMPHRGLDMLHDMLAINSQRQRLIHRESGESAPTTNVTLNSWVFCFFSMLLATSRHEHAHGRRKHVTPLGHML